MGKTSTIQCKFYSRDRQLHILTKSNVGCLSANQFFSSDVSWYFYCNTVVWIFSSQHKKRRGTNRAGSAYQASVLRSIGRSHIMKGTVQQGNSVEHLSEDIILLLILHALEFEICFCLLAWQLYFCKRGRKIVKNGKKNCKNFSLNKWSKGFTSSIEIPEKQH